MPGQTVNICEVVTTSRSVCPIIHNCLTKTKCSQVEATTKLVCRAAMILGDLSLNKFENERNFVRKRVLMSREVFEMNHRVGKMSKVLKTLNGYT